ncbi:hypothetical protein BATDEDRAFT_87637 [Batrachochytrium dendrobatidis JAM81]|uniref:Uncharacterized protein n=2 Tax=Batrachochytrium dendrobatidis TaxID=109871 RepID=F4P0W9_BATDJ|nr:uncharacterized protein BATDEDRAFT_87637 [Batrachochytrium dendrobatidis JAM81]EGF81663.1 hypothetical protein BATDEDRAFT_87637 [Batrachochytrium dendrobatidis JAM81]OAJ37981.1 hypothetical protein BDEG_21949 [Batrachochytrium dendrobatidis JEL423]|eukprot:XP_006678283.1 hypothetical protein BATDEDRAFT_87637 [Batrachochytrium dendrobatidis JAM81]
MSLTVTFQGRKFQTSFDSEYTRLGDEWADAVTLRQLIDQLSQQSRVPAENIKLLSSGGERSRHPPSRRYPPTDSNRHSPIGTRSSPSKSSAAASRTPHTRTSAEYSSTFYSSSPLRNQSSEQSSFTIPDRISSASKHSNHKQSQHPLPRKKSSGDRDSSSVAVSAWGKFMDLVEQGSNAVTGFLDRLDGSGSGDSGSSNSREDGSSRTIGEDSGSWGADLE